MENLRELWNKTCLNARIPAISTDTAARIMAVVYVHGNNESFTFSFYHKENYRTQNIDGSVITSVGVLFLWPALAFGNKALEEGKVAKISKGDTTITINDNDDDNEGEGY